MIKAVIIIIIMAAFFLFTGVELFATYIAAGNQELYWAVFGAIGSTAGSMIGAAAIVISIVALVMPYMVRLAVNMNQSYTQKPGAQEKSDEEISISIVNIGIKPVQLNDICIGTKKEFASIRAAQHAMILNRVYVSLPVRLEQGQEYSATISGKALKYLLDRVKGDGRLYVMIEEASMGHKLFYKMPWTVNEL